jgi:hypothetical protein
MGERADAVVMAVRWLRAHPEVADVLLGNAPRFEEAAQDGWWAGHGSASEYWNS